MTAVLTSPIRAALRELSDVEYQSRVWTGQDAGGEMSSFAECVSRLYDDSGLELALDDDQHVFGSSIDHDLRTLGTLVLQIDSSQGPEETVADPRMRRVRELAGTILHDVEEAHDPAQ